MTANLSAKSWASVYQLRSLVNRIVPTRTALKRNIHTQSSSFFQISEEVQHAINSKAPVVALESAIYTHGFPYPDNIALASHLESVIRLNGGIPATIGVINGVARVGLEAQELVELAASAGKPRTIKVSRRDLGPIFGLGLAGRLLNGGTTVSGTMVLAERAGIHVFATGGLGGVHRGGQDTMDISADLTELGRTKVAVVSSGCKSFLDIPRTLEVLETQGVGVCTFADGRDGQVDFPSFWSRDSGVRSPVTIYSEEEAAAIAYAQFTLPVSSGLLLANPIPQQHAIAKSEMDIVIAQAISDAERTGSTGNANTPFVLERIRQISGGRSIAANRSLIEANAARAAKVAVRLTEIFRRTQERPAPSLASKSQPSPSTKDEKSAVLIETQKLTATEKADVLVAGSVAIDLACNYLPQSKSVDSVQPRYETSNPASIKQSVGGVGHNIATSISYLGVSVLLCSRVASDIAGEASLLELSRRGLSLEGIHKCTGEARTANYVAFNDADKNLMMAMADMDIFEDEQEQFEGKWQACFDKHKPSWLVVDANWNPSTLRKLIQAGRACGAKIALEPVSVEKSRRLFAGESSQDSQLAVIPNASIDVATPNALELSAMFEAASSAGFLERDDWFKVIDSFGLSSFGSHEKLVALTNTFLTDQGIPQQSIQLLPFIPCIITTLGKHGVLVTQALLPEDSRLTSPEYAPFILARSTAETSSIGGIYMRHFLTAEKVDPQDIVSVNGAGDTFLGALIAGLTKSGPSKMPEMVEMAQRCSVASLKSEQTVNPVISKWASVR